MSTQRASAASTVSRSVSRISWSSAPRLSGFEILMRTTLAAGSSTSSLPDASSRLLKLHQRVALGYRLPLLDEDRLDGPLVLRLDGHLHLHRLEDRDGVALGDLLADLALDLPDRPGDVRLDVRQLRSSSMSGDPARYPPVERQPAVVVSAWNEADRIGATLAALRDAFPGARLFVADDYSDDGTAAVAREAGAEVVTAPKRMGKGGATTLAAREAMNEQPALLLLCDGDLGESARQLPRLVEASERGGGDLAVGSFARRVGGGFGIALGFARWTIKRRAGIEPDAPISGQGALRRGGGDAAPPVAAC